MTDKNRFSSQIYESYIAMYAVFQNALCITVKQS